MVVKLQPDLVVRNHKIKFYFSVNTQMKSIDDFASTEQMLETKIDTIIKQMKLD